MRLKPLFTWRSAICAPESGLTSTQRLVALVLSLHMSERGDSCFPSTRTLAGETQFSRSTVVLALDALEDAGWLHVIRPKKVGRGRHNRYEARIPESVRRSDIYLEEVSDGPKKSVRLASKKGPTIGPEDVKLLGRQEDVGVFTPKPNPEGAARAKALKESLRRPLPIDEPQEPSTAEC